MAEAERRMQKTPPEAAYKMFLGMSGYDNAAPVRRLSSPLRAINGDLYPTDVEGVREIKQVDIIESNPQESQLGGETASRTCQQSLLSRSPQFHQGTLPPLLGQGMNQRPV